MKKILVLLAAVVIICVLAVSAFTDEKIRLLVWVGDDADQQWISGVIENFKQAYSDQTFDIQVGVIAEPDAKNAILQDPTAAADVFTFAHDQIIELQAAGALQEITPHAEAVITSSGGEDAGAVQAATLNGKLYAYPATADNGYFMFYNQAYFSQEDILSLNKMLDIAAQNGKYISYDLDAAWYLYAFFAGAGLELEIQEDQSNRCNWNATDTEITGVQVAQAILDIAAHPGFINQSDAEFIAGVKDGAVIAGVNGAWNAKVAQEAWGESYAAAKLPTFSVGDQEKQMASFAGYKLVGVNAYSANVGYAMRLAEYMTNYESQLSRFALRGQGPANIQAAAAPEVMADPAIAALSAQSAFARAQNVGPNYWAPADTFGAIMAAGNPEGTDLQQLLDQMVAGITAPVR